MTLYDGITDPLDHVNHYKQKMMVITATESLKEACICKAFGSTLSGAALQWFVDLPNKSITNFADLVNAFNQQFASSGKPEKQTSDLYRIVRRKGEADLLPKVSEYGFTTNLAGLFKALQKLGRRVRWPKPPAEGYSSSREDTCKKCEFHGNNTHDIDECHSLQKEVKYHYDRGNLDHILPRGTTRVNSTDQVMPSPPPQCTRIVSVITGGLELCGLTYSVAKRRVAEAKGDKLEYSCRINPQNLPSVTFDKTDAQSSPEPQHIALIITLPIGNCEVKKILIDTGNSVNLIMLETLKGMRFSEKDLAKKAVPMVGFSRETKHSLGEIVIPSYAGRVNKQVRYLVIDRPSIYNVILGRPWIHEIKAIPSTYHQCLMFPTPSGVKEIRGDLEEAKDCYKVALKSTTSPPT
ncbi:uncharacterized protein LOC141601328 [Silene latifolia]|uniref:uncharacterized protein LOC141601328 n=1 Tax=Silene latifolia TaxID=37657 RepID=UPI003D77B72C